MFTKISFYYDEGGLPRGEHDDECYDRGGCWRDRPFVLDVRHCNAKYFYVSHSQMRGHSYPDPPALKVWRHCGPISKDPWNEDGRPPTMMFQIAMPHFSFFEHNLEVEGLESGNLCLAGLLTPPYYECGRKAIKGAKYMSDELKEQRHFQPFRDLKRQRVLLHGHYKGK